jgi:hypothetical protein
MRLVLVAFALVLAACGELPSPALHSSEAHSAGPAPFSEHLIATIPEGVDVEVPIAFTRDGLQAAYVARTPEGCWAVRGAWKSTRLDAL